MPEPGSAHPVRVWSRPDLPDTWEAAVIPIDKPSGVTSFGVIRRMRRLTGVRRIGHAGTLDPMATGLLIVLTGGATRSAALFTDLPKTYRGTLRLGEVTSSWDAETEVTARRDPSVVTDQSLTEQLARFKGTITQVTPAYSAVKVGGERLYRKARRGEHFELPSRVVTIDRFELTGRRGPDVDFEVNCSKGTYVRSLAHELGTAVGVGAHLVALRRTAIGRVHVDAAWTLEDLAARLDEGA